MDGKAKGMIEREGEAYAARLISAIVEIDLDPAAMPIVFMGGDASLIKRHVVPRFGLCCPIIITDVTVNAK